MASSFITVGQIFYSIARQRGVGGDQAPLSGGFTAGITAVTLENAGDDLNLLVIEVGGNFYKNWDLSAVLGHQLGPRFSQSVEQLVQRAIGLQRSEVLGVGARNVDRDVIRVWVYAG